MASRILPNLVVAAILSSDEKGRRMARAVLNEYRKYVVSPPEPVGDTSTLLDRLRSQAPEGTIVVGFDFPIGLPQLYAEKRKFKTFRHALSLLEDSFFEVTDKPCLEQPFYPLTQEKGRQRSVLAKALLVQSLTDLLRNCDEATEHRQAAECLFFTMGAKQVGRGAILGWRDVIKPALDEILLWPCDGPFAELIAPRKIVIVEIYPTEAYHHLGFEIGSGTKISKANADDRRRVAKHLLQAESRSIRISKEARRAIKDGFQSGDDFDAMVSLLSMLQVVTGKRSADMPLDDKVRTIEGWIFGQTYVPTAEDLRRDLERQSHLNGWQGNDCHPTHLVAAAEAGKGEALAQLNEAVSSRSSTTCHVGGLTDHLQQRTFERLRKSDPKVANCFYVPGRWAHYSEKAYYPLPDLLFFGFRDELGSVRAVRFEDVPEDLEEKIGQMFDDMSKSDHNPFKIAMMEIRTKGQTRPPETREYSDLERREGLTRRAVKWIIEEREKKRTLLCILLEGKLQGEIPRSWTTDNLRWCMDNHCPRDLKERYEATKRRKRPLDSQDQKAQGLSWLSWGYQGDNRYPSELVARAEHLDQEALMEFARVVSERTISGLHIGGFTERLQRETFTRLRRQKTNVIDCFYLLGGEIQLDLDAFEMPDLLLFVFTDKTSSAVAVRLEDVPDDLKYKIGRMFDAIGKRSPYLVRSMPDKQQEQDPKPSKRKAKPSFASLRLNTYKWIIDERAGTEPLSWGEICTEGQRTGAIPITWNHKYLRVYVSRCCPDDLRDKLEATKKSQRR
jgi:hypothetical protein